MIYQWVDKAGNRGMPIVTFSGQHPLDALARGCVRYDDDHGATNHLHCARTGGNFIKTRLPLSQRFARPCSHLDQRAGSQNRNCDKNRVRHHLGAGNFLIPVNTLTSLQVGSSGGSIGASQSTTGSATAQVTYSHSPVVNQVPEPATLALLGFGLAGPAFSPGKQASESALGCNYDALDGPPWIRLD